MASYNVFCLQLSATQVTKISFIDYIFNASSIFSLEFYISPGNFKSIFKTSDPDNILIVKFPLQNVTITGQVASYQITKSTSSTSPFLVSALLVPLGAPDQISVNLDGVSGPTVRSSITTLRGATFSIKNNYGASHFSPSEQFPYIVSYSDSLVGAIMSYRRRYTQEGYSNFIKVNDSKHLYHRILYLMFGTEKRSNNDSTTKQGTALPVTSASMLFGDVDFAVPSSSNSLQNIYPSIVETVVDAVVSCSSGSQALMNNIFSYVPRLVQTYENIIGHLINETYTITLSGKLSSKFPEFSFDTGGSSFRSGTPIFGRYSVWPKDITQPLPPWEENDPVFHLKTVYQYNEDGSGGQTGHTVQYIFGRLNSKLVPHLNPPGN